GRLAVPLRHDRRTGRVRGFHDADLLPGQHPGAGAGLLSFRRFRAGWRALHPAGHVGFSDPGTPAVSALGHPAAAKTSISGISLPLRPALSSPLSLTRTHHAPPP